MSSHLNHRDVSLKKGGTSTSSSNNQDWRKMDIGVLEGYKEAQEVKIHTDEARLRIEQQRFFLYLRILFGLFTVAGSIAIYVYFDIKKMTHLYQDLVDITNKTTPVTGVSGSHVAICLTSHFFDRWFSPSPNPFFSNALWMMWYTQPIRKRLITVYGGNIIQQQTGLVPMWTAAVTSLKAIAQLDVNKSVHQLICEVTKTKADGALGSMCFPTCPLMESPGADVGTSVMQSGMGMAGSIGGVAMLAGPGVGLIGGAIGMIAGGILGGMQANAAKKKYEEKCKSIRDGGTCFWPSTFPSCDLG